MLALIGLAFPLFLAGQLIIAAASIADFGGTILLSLFFSEQATGIGLKLGLPVGLTLVAALLVFGLARPGITMPAERVVGMLADTTARSGSRCCCSSSSWPCKDAVRHG